MKGNRIRILLLWLLCAALLLPAGAGTEGAADGQGTGMRGKGLPAGEETVSALMEDILSRNLREAGAASLQEWVDGALADTADGTGGWYLTALVQSGARFSDLKCRETLERAAGEEIRSITRRLRISLTMTALGMESGFPGETAAALAEEKTLMPLVFGLHLLNNDVRSPGISREEIVSRLLALQLEDGGWAVIGTECDVDCTAMTLQALAPLCTAEERVRAAAERGLAALSLCQQENGGFLGMGLESAESCAQVLLALSCLGIDCGTDERFLKNGFSVLDAMLRFRLEDGSFAHDLSGKGPNETATVQAYYALAGYRRMLRGQGPYYVFDEREKETKEAGEKEAPAEEPGGAGKEVSRTLLCAGVALAGLLACGVSWLRRRRNWRTYAFIGAVTLVMLFGASRIRIQSAENYYAAGPRTGPEIGTWISIRCDTVAGQNEYAPADGEILAETRIGMEEGRTAFDQLAEATRIHRIQMEYDGTTAGAYVRGIGYLYEYDFGNLSGWMYRINGVFADVGASQYVLREGDRIDWVYTTNIGRDAEEAGGEPDGNGQARE